MIDRMRFLLGFVLITAPSAQTSADWPHYGGTQLSWRYSTLDQINAGNVKNLAPAWIFQTGDYAENLQSTPLVIDGAMYLNTGYVCVISVTQAKGLLHSPMRTAIRGRSRPFAWQSCP